MAIAIAKTYDMYGIPVTTASTRVGGGDGIRDCQDDMYGIPRMSSAWPISDMFEPHLFSRRGFFEVWGGILEKYFSGWGRGEPILLVWKNSGD